VNREIVRQVRERARERCEYFHIPTSLYPLPFTADHIIARQHGGLTVLENLSLSCLHCNRHKGPNIAGRDQQTGQLVRLFHPRTDRWHDHSKWDGAVLVGVTAIGQTTVHVLAINEPDFLAVREALIREQSNVLE
jgi:hypothetical protein